MAIKNSPQYEQIKEAMEVIHDLKIPEHLQQKALEHLLQGASGKQVPTSAHPASGGQISTTSELRDFIAGANPKGAVTEIPTLLYWAKEHEQNDLLDEDGIVELYRRASLRPPKNIAQSIRDLASKKKYGRLEAVKDQPGYVRLSRTGEDFVIHDVLKTTRA